MSDPIIIIAKVDRPEAFEAVERLLQVEPGGLAFRGNMAIADNDDDWFHDGAYLLTPAEFCERFISQPYERGFNAAKEPQPMSMLTEIPRAIQRMVTGRDPKIASEQAKRYAVAAAEYAKLPAVKASLRDIEKRMAEVQPKVASGELAPRALGNLQDQWQAASTQVSRLENAVATDVRTNHPNRELLAQWGALRAKKGALSRKLTDAKQVVDKLKEELRIAQAAVGDSTRIVSDLMVLRGDRGTRNEVYRQSTQTEAEQRAAQARLEDVQAELADATEEVLDAERIRIEHQEQIDSIRAELLLPIK